MVLKGKEIGGKNEIWKKDAFRDEEVELIESQTKINVKTISGGF